MLVAIAIWFKYERLTPNIKKVRAFLVLYTQSDSRLQGLCELKLSKVELLLLYNQLFSTYYQTNFWSAAASSNIFDWDTFLTSFHSAAAASVYPAIENRKNILWKPRYIII